MKKSFTILIAIVLCMVTAEAQWNQSFLGPYFFRTLSLVNDSVLWVSDNAQSHFSITTNGGKTWTNKNYPASLSQPGVLSAVSASVAYIVSNSSPGIYKTSDTGNNWVLQPTGFNQNSPFPDFVYFWNENDGVAVGDAYPNPNFEIYTTNNGGNQWNLVPEANMPAGNSQWSFNNRSGGFRVHGDTIYFIALGIKDTTRIFKSINKGINWTAINTPLISAGPTFDFKDGNNGLLSYRDTLYSTSDGGKNWSLIETSGFSSFFINYLPFAESYFSTSGRGLLYSKDNGKTWTKHPSFVGVALESVASSPSNKIYMTSVSGYLYSSVNYSESNLAINDLQIIDSLNIEVYFSTAVEPHSAEDTANYKLFYSPGKSIKNIKIVSATLDNSNSSLGPFTSRKIPSNRYSKPSCEQHPGFKWIFCNQ